MKIQITDRYSATGTPYPNPDTMCKGYCEGMGCYPHNTCMNYMFINQPTELEATEQLEWEKEHKKQMWKTLGLHYFVCDGWHFIKCPTCNGTRLDNSKIN